MSTLVETCPHCNAATRVFGVVSVGGHVRCSICKKEYTVEGLEPEPELVAANEETETVSYDAPPRRWSRGELVLIGFLGMALLPMLLVFPWKPKPTPPQPPDRIPDTTRPEEGKPRQPLLPPAPELQEPTVRTKSIRFAESHAALRGVADRRFRGRIVELTGKLVKMERPNDFPGIVFRLEGDVPSRWVTCRMKVGSKPWEYALPGQEVVVRGKMAMKKFAFVSVEDCEVVKARGHALNHWEAAELGNAITSQTEFLPQAGFWIRVRGEVTKVEIDREHGAGKIFMVELDGGKGRTIAAVYGDGIDPPDRFIVGDRITVVGLYVNPKDEIGDLVLRKALVVDVEK